ncbi:MAG: TDT family transporter [Pseudomonadales bacterium]
MYNSAVSQIKQKLSLFPTPAAGLALAIASLGWCWENNAALGGYAQHSAAIVSALLACLLLAKFTLNPKRLLDELAHPVVGSVLPTFAMTLMVISKVLAGTAGQYLWLSAVAIHCVFLALFVIFRLKAFKIEQMAPSWFVPPVGLVVASLTNPGDATFAIATALLEFGIVSYLIMLPVMLYRLIFCEALPDAAKPTLAILAAPPNLCLAGYLSLVEQPSTLFTLFMLSLALLMTLLVYLAFINLLRLPFSPAYAAFTFPVVISATAIGKTANFLEAEQQSAALIDILYTISYSELLIASAVVGYVAIRYLRHYLAKPVAKPVAAKPSCA